jgi:hypothetical protein
MLIGPENDCEICGVGVGEVAVCLMDGGAHHLPPVRLITRWCIEPGFGEEASLRGADGSGKSRDAHDRAGVAGVAAAALEAPFFSDAFMVISFLIIW